MSVVTDKINEAIAHLRAANIDGARAALQEADKIDSQARDLNLVYAMYYASLGNVPMAYNRAQKELSLHPENPYVKDLIASLGIKEDRMAQAAPWAKAPEAPAQNALPLDELTLALRAGASSQQVKQRVLTVLEKVGGDVERYRYGSKYSELWFEQISALNYVASLLRPKNYLQVGLQESRNLAQVEIESPKTETYGFDWSDQYHAPLSTQLRALDITKSAMLVVGKTPGNLEELFTLPNIPQLFELISLDSKAIQVNAKQVIETALNHLAPGGVLVVDGMPESWSEIKNRLTDYLFIADRYNQGTTIMVKPGFERIQSALLQRRSAAQKLKVVMPYSIKRQYGKITLPEWIKETLQVYFADEVEVISVGPGHTNAIEDSPGFYDAVTQFAKEQSADLIFDIEGGAESIDFMFKRFPKKGEIPSIYWAIDSHQYLEQQKEKAKYFDHVYTAQKNAVSAFAPGSEWLPAGASLHEVDFQRERSIGVGFIGSISPAHGQRAAVINHLLQEFPQFLVQQGVFLEDKAEFLSRMKIAINVSLNNDVNFRVFETLASGALLITDKINSNGLEDLFEDGKHLVTYSSASDLVTKIRYYLSHEEERKKIAAAGKELVDRMFRHHHIMRKVVDRMYEMTGKAKPADDSLQRAALEKRCWCGGATCQTANPLYVQCLDCGTQVLTKNYTEEELKKFYGAEAYWRDRQVQVFNFPPIEERANNDFNDRIPVWFEVLDHYKKQPKRLLEIGCAHGGFLYYCRERGAEQVCGVEVDQGTCDFAKKRFNLPHVMAGLFPDVPLPFETFDAITGFDVIEHFLDPVGGLRAVANKLSDDGICFFQTPCYRGEGGDWVQYKPAEHTFLYTEKGIRKLFDQVGLEIVEILPGYFKDDMFVIGRKKRARVVFVRPDAIGDNVLATGMLKPIAEKYGSKISVVCSELVKPIYENHPYVDEIIGFDRERVPMDTEYAHQLSEKLAKLNASVALHSVYSREVLGDWLSYATNAPERIGFRGNLSNIGEDRRDRNNQYYTQIIESDALELPEPMRHQEFLRALGVSTPILKSDIVLTDEEHRFAAEFFTLNRLSPEKTIILGAQAAHSIKNYPFWRDALNDLVVKQGWFVLALGAEKDAEVVDELLNGSKWRAINLCGKISLRQSAALISRSRLVASVDTSIAHIACAMNVPNVVILGGGHFGRFFPYSSSTSVVCLPLDCYRCDWHCKFGRGNNYCITKVSAAVVAEAIQETLRTTSTKPRMFVQRDIVFSETVEKKPATVPVTHFIDPERVEIITVDGEKAVEQRWGASSATDSGALNVLR